MKPKPSDYRHRYMGDRVVYLDDVDQVAANLSEHGPVVIEVLHAGDATSIVDSALELLGRADVWNVEVKVQIPDPTRLGGFYEPAAVTVSNFAGVTYLVEQDRSDLVAICEHFLSTLEEEKPAPRWRRLARRRKAPQILITDTRATTWTNTKRRRHELRLALVSGAVGAALGALATVVAAVLTH